MPANCVERFATNVFEPRLDLGIEEQDGLARQIAQFACNFISYVGRLVIFYAGTIFFVANIIVLKELNFAIHWGIFKITAPLFLTGFGLIFVSRFVEKALRLEETRNHIED